MRSTTDSTAVAVDKRPNLISSLFPSVVSGIVIGVVGAVIAGLLMNRVTTAYSPDGVPNDDAVAASVFIAWVLFFMIGIGAFNGIFEWAFGRHEPTPAEGCRPAILSDSTCSLFCRLDGSFFDPAGAIKTRGDLLQPIHVQHHCGHARHHHDSGHHYHDYRSCRQLCGAHHDWCP